jgi:hypothetical protein
VQFLLPAYNRQFGLRGDLQAAATLDPSPRLICYPQRYDSASFYLPEAVIQVYTTTQRRELLADVLAHPQSLLLVRSGRGVRDLLDELPASLEFVPVGKHASAVTVGWVRQRADPLAQR